MKVPLSERMEFSARGAANLKGAARTRSCSLLHDGQIGAWRTEGGQWRVPRREIEVYQRRMVARHDARTA